MGYKEEYDPDVHITVRGDILRFPKAPEDGRFIFYNLHLPGNNCEYGTPVGVVALLVNPEHLDFIARGVAIRSLVDKWDPQEGRIRAAGRALRAYQKHQTGEDNTVVSLFSHEYAVSITAMHGLGAVKCVVPAHLTIREDALLQKRGLVVEDETISVEFLPGHSQNSG